MKQAELVEQLLRSCTDAPPKNFPSKSFRCYYDSCFFNPYGALLQPRHRDLTSLELKQLEKFFKRFQPRTSVESKTPFLCVLPRQLNSSAYKLLHLEGWKELELDTRLNIFSQRRSTHLPKGYHVCVSDLYCKHERRKHIEVVAKLFKGPKLKSELETYYTRRTKNKDFLIVNIYSQKNQVCATAATGWRGDKAGLYSGCVLPRYRRRGLWQALVGFRQLHTFNRGVKHWYLTTHTSAILDQAEHSIRFKIFQKR